MDEIPADVLERIGEQFRRTTFDGCLALFVAFRTGLTEVIEHLEQGEHEEAHAAAMALRERVTAMENEASRLVADIDAKLGQGG